MACDFTVILNPGPKSQLAPASESLNLVGEIEEQLSVYRDSSEVSRLNRYAARMPFSVKQNLFDLLLRSRELSVELNGAFDPTAGPLLRLWRRCQDDHRLPTPDEIATAIFVVGMHHVQLDNENLTVAFDGTGVELNFGANGKGYAVDRAGDVLSDAGVDDWLIHGGHSSILARGKHAGHSGWPIGLRNPLFPRETWATILLSNQAMATSGSGVQFYRIQGRRYNHIIDPRIGWPVEGQLSVTVFAPTAEIADTLSTAFFVMGVEKGREYCKNHPEIAAILTPPPETGRTLKPILCNIPPENLFFHQDIDQFS
ncbi:MAG: FAD:protein FMN transferase [Planctomycetota bacterium]|nr:FAD:protein FMN transferase [Planctomycetota bacterium]MDA1214866.1 FAD:protein FMN transferase [Planctomycetota bacterium]